MNLNQELHPIGQGAYSHFNTLLNSYHLAEQCIKQNIPGAFVECGVGAGSQVAAMALACKHQQVKKDIILCDSFNGIPLANHLYDTSQPGIGEISESTKKITNAEDLLVSSEITVHSLQNVKSNLQKWGVANAANFTYIEGWFQHTLPTNTIGNIAILRLDGDLHDSTLVCLEHLFPKLVSGGFLIIDDWALEGCVKACNTYFGDYHQLHEINHVADTTPVWFVKK